MRGYLQSARLASRQEPISCGEREQRLCAPDLRALPPPTRWQSTTTPIICLKPGHASSASSKRRATHEERARARAASDDAKTVGYPSLREFWLGCSTFDLALCGGLQGCR